MCQNAHSVAIYILHCVFFISHYVFIYQCNTYPYEKGKVAASLLGCGKVAARIKVVTTLYNENATL